MTQYDLSLEQALIGALCVGREDVLKDVIRFLKPDDFMISSCGEIYRLLFTKFVRNELIDLNLMPKELETKISEPFQYLRECMMMAPTTNNAALHAHIVHDAATERELRSKVLECFDSYSGEELRASIIQCCRESSGNDEGRRVTAYDLAMSLMDNLNQSVELRLDTGFPRLDGILQGMSAGNLILIGARPSVGKTSFSLELARSVAQKGHKVQFYSLEMTAKELGQRYLSNMSMVPLTKILRNEMNDDDIVRYVQAGARFSEIPLIIEDSTNLTVEKIRAEAMREPEVHAIFIDYIGLMHTSEKHDNRNYELGAISRSLKSLAMELEIPIIVMAQLNRNVQPGEEPHLSDLRDSGELEQNANKVIFLWNVDAEQGIRGVKVAKNRSGETGTVQMNFDGAHQKFIERSEDIPVGSSYFDPDEDYSH